MPDGRTLRRRGSGGDSLRHVCGTIRAAVLDHLSGAAELREEDWERLRLFFERGGDIEVGGSSRRIWTELALQDRNTTLRRIWQTHYPGKSAHDAAGRIASDLKRYSTSGWTRERSLAAAPVEGGLRRLLWQCLRADERLLKPDTIARILRG